MDGKIDGLYEWAIWGNLHSKSNIELILLKGHLYMELSLNICLSRNNLDYSENFSFYRKIKLLENIKLQDEIRKDFLVTSLRELNQMRNSLAHEVHFDLEEDGKFELWSDNIQNNLKGEKYSRFTYRTKIVHSFSTLAKNLLELY